VAIRAGARQNSILWTVSGLAKGIPLYPLTWAIAAVWALAPVLAQGTEKSPCAVMLVPGAFYDSGTKQGSSLFLTANDYFAEYRDFFAGQGCEVGTAEFPPDGTIEERGLILRDQLDRFRGKNGGVAIDIVAHSQGGLDARYALRSLKLAGVRTLTTIGTPHMGTPLADWVVRTREQETWVYWALRLVGRYDLQALRFAGEFQPSFIERVSDRLSAVAGVRYASARGVCKRDCRWYFGLLDWWVGIGQGDGVSPGESQRFGQDLGTYDLDHLSQVARDPGKRTERQRLLRAIWAFIKS
jgi:pimeloyl-ACP methyl ester carboxylesterase